jgi:hypothetical protein
MDMVTPMVSHTVFGDRAIAARFLRTTALSQNGDGRMFFPYPSWFSFELPDQTMWWGMQLWQYYLHFGDAALLQQLYPVARRANDWFQAHLSARGLLQADWPDDEPRVLWPWIDHGHRFRRNLPCEKKGEMAALDAFYYKFLVDAGSMARTVGQPEEAAAFDEQARQLKIAFNAAYRDEATGAYWDDPGHTIPGPHASVLAVLYGLAPPGDALRILDQVIDEAGHVGHAQPHFYAFVLEALARSGRYSRALDTIRGRWGSTLAGGATTFPEVWIPDRDFFGNPWPAGTRHHYSMAHGYSAAPTVFLNTMTVGVRPLGPGFSRFLVAPSIEGLAWVDGGVPTPGGTIAVSWRMEDVFTLRVSGPAGASAVVSIPRLPAGEVFVDGVPIWRGAAQVPGDPRVRVTAVTPGRVVVEAQPGSYTFVSR